MKSVKVNFYRLLVTGYWLLTLSCAEFSEVFEVKSDAEISVSRQGETTSSEPDRFIWPVDGKLTSRFGVRRRRQHDGIDISAPKGTLVKASARGRIIYSGRLAGYGGLIVIQHAGHYFTAYAHLAQRQVSKGDRVQQGQPIGLVGSTGRSTGPHCHFEIRQKTAARNPLFFLPQREGVAESGTGS